MTMKSVATGEVVNAKSKPRQKVVREIQTSAAADHKMKGSRPSSSRKRTGRVASSDLEDTEVPPSDIMLLLDEQRKDIDRVVAGFDNLQQEVVSLKDTFKSIQPKQDGASSVSVKELDLITDNVSKVNRKLSELDILKFEMTMMQQRFRRMEEARPVKQPSPTAVKPAQTPLLASAADSQVQTLILSSPPVAGATLQTTPRALKIPALANKHAKIASVSLDAMNSVSHAAHTPKLGDSRGPMLEDSSLNINHQNAPPPLNGISQMIESGQGNSPEERSDYTLKVPPANFIQSPRIPHVTPDFQDASIQEILKSEKDEDSDEINSPHITSPKQTSVNFVHQPRKRRRQSVVASLPTSEWDEPSRAGLQNTDAESTLGQKHDSKRRKTATLRESSARAVDNAEVSLWAPAQPASSLRDERGVLVRANGQVDRRSSRWSQNHSWPQKSHKRSDGPRDAEGYLLRQDGKRDSRSVYAIDSAKKKAK
ncbi:hypothetical protein MMC28_002130 [Mycoblastus sanguinarius]|nr:hypothetical protein [Mycoblastus sanguinarius]